MIKSAKALVLSMLILLTGCASGQPDISAVSEVSKTTETSNVEYYNPNEGTVLDLYETANRQAETKEEALAKGKTVLTLFDALGETGVIGHIVKAFNLENEQYYVEFNAMEAISMDETRARLKMDLASGKGPDMMTLYALPDANRLMHTGCFYDLSAFLSEINVTDSNFLPAVRTLTMDNKVYGVCVERTCLVSFVKESVIGGQTIPSFAEFIDMLLDYPEDAILYNEYQPASIILEWFLRPSESLRGTIDRASNTCDFTSELFSKVLDVCKRYADARDKGYEPIMATLYPGAGTYPGEKQMDKDGWVKVNFWFDDGNYPFMDISSGIIANAASDNIEGIKSFISFALSPQGQSFTYSGSVSRSFLKAQLQNDLENYEKGLLVCNYPITEDVVEDIIENAENARFGPYGNEDIMDIILEESESFFSGAKSKEDVINIIQNRVSILLSETQ